MIHPTAIVSESANIADGVQIGPFTIVGDDVRKGAALNTIQIAENLIKSYL